MTDTRTLIQPDTRTLAVNRHPHHTHGDAISLRYTDLQTGEQHTLVVPVEAAAYLALLFDKAANHPGIGAHADQLRAEQRERPHGNNTR